MWPWIEYLDIVVIVFSACLIGSAAWLQRVSRKLNRLQTIMVFMEMEQHGTVMWWRKRALEAEGELRRLKENDR